MDVKDIKRLLEAVEASGISELVLETGDYKLSVKRGGVSLAPVEPAPAPQQSTQQSAPAAQPAPAPAAAEPESPANNLTEVAAPIVGTFYASPSPDAPSFVKVGDRVQAGTVLCIIEAMKLMNEIEAETAGVVREILVRDTEPVEYGQALFRLEPV